MQYKEIRPCKILTPYVKCLWILEDEARAEKRMEKVLPDACPELIIHYGDKFRIKDKNGKARTQPRSFVFGPLTKYIEIGPAGRTGVISARFYPGGAAAFLPVPVCAITNQYVSLRSLFGKKGGELEKEICSAGSFSERKTILENFLIRLLPAKQPAASIIPYELNNRIVNKSEPVKIEYLSRELNLGRRHLERKFSKEVGMTPKTLVKIIRFQNVFRILQQKAPSSLTELTYEAGYYDQSHFTRDFKAFSGLTPKEYFKDDAILTRLFATGA